MIVALDARTVYTAGRRGTGKNLIDLYRHLAAARPQWQFVMYHRGQGTDEPFGGVANIRSQRIDMPGDRLNLWQNVRLPLAARTAGAGLLHAPANIGPPRPLVPLLATIHDLIPLDARLKLPGAREWGQKVGRTARAASRIITPSAFSKGQIVEAFGVSADKIIVSHWAADVNCRRITDTAELRRVRAAYGLAADRPYVFGFGAADLRKNTRRIIEAWAALPRKLRQDWALLIVGIQEPALGEFRAAAEALGLADSVRLHGFAAEGDIPALTSGAAVLCYPSLSEGFGLPVLDAFACGAAVLTSDSTSLPEVAGEAALLVTPEKTESIARGLEQILSDERLRADLVRRGYERLKLFTWQATTERVLQAMDEAINLRGEA